jgi:hypothetical protein
MKDRLFHIRAELSFNVWMKNKRLQKEGGTVLHAVDEGQTTSKENRNSP